MEAPGVELNPVDRCSAGLHRLPSAFADLSEVEFDRVGSSLRCLGNQWATDLDAYGQSSRS